MLRCALASTMVLLGSGCGLLKKAYEKPKLTFKAAHERRMGLDGLELQLVYDVENPNPVAVTVARADVTLVVEGQRLATVSPRERMAVPARGHVELTFPAHVRFGDLYESAVALRHQSVAHYRTEGTVGVETPVGVVDLPIQGEGDFALPNRAEVKEGLKDKAKDKLESGASKVPLLRDLVRKPR